MPDDGHAPTLPETLSGPGSSSRGAPLAPDARYVMQHLLGRGGMGEVWLAHDERIDRDIAIKMLRGDGRHDPEAVARFLREARVQGRLEHPAIPPVHDLGDSEAGPYFAMKRLTGATLADVLASPELRERWPRRLLLARLVDVCLCVELAHQRGVIHRDLKPANIMLGDFGETYVLDWGLARVANAAELGAIPASDLRGDSGVVGQTVVGAMLGTPGYMAPEQMRGEDIDHRADIFALGCILYEILTGVPAVPRDTAFEVTLAAAGFRPSAEPDADVPPELDDLCARTTAASRQLRPQTARALGDAIQQFLDGDRDLERRRELAAARATHAISLLSGAPSNTARADAMREAGRAIALDPENRDAAAVMSRLMFEPPREMPDAAQRRIYDERQAAGRAVIRAGAYAYAVNIAILLAVQAAGYVDPWAFYALLGLSLPIVALCFWGSQPPRTIGFGLFALVMSLHITVLATLGIAIGPLLVLPIFVFGSLPLFLLFPSVSYPVTTFLGHTVAFMVPLVLEWLGLVPNGYAIEGGALVIRPWAFHMPPRLLVGVVVLLTLMQVVIHAVSFIRQRRAQERSQELVHLQTWQLAQLMPR